MLLFQQAFALNPTSMSRSESKFSCSVKVSVITFLSRFRLPEEHFLVWSVYLKSLECPFENILVIAGVGVRPEGKSYLSPHTRGCYPRGKWGGIWSCFVTETTQVSKHASEAPDFFFSFLHNMDVTHLSVSSTLWRDFAAICQCHDVCPPSRRY